MAPRVEGRQCAEASGDVDGALPSSDPQRPHGSDRHEIAAPVAHATGRTPHEVGWLLGGAPAATETEMLGLAAALAALEKEIRRR